MTLYFGRLVAENGSTLDVSVTYNPPPPTVISFPDGANMVTIGTKSYPLSAIDPPTTDPTKPGGRDEDQLIIITKKDTPPRNRWGFERQVVKGITGLGGVNGTVPDLGFLLSAHGRAIPFVKNAAAGQVVTVWRSDPAPGGGSSNGGTTGSSEPLIGEYVMDGVGHVSQLSPKCDTAFIAFLQGTSLVEWGGDTPAQTSKDFRDWKANRVKAGLTANIVVSLGGQGGNVNLDQVDETFAAIAGGANPIPINGVDFDAEAFKYTPAQAVDVATRCAAVLGLARKDFLVCFPPPGGDPVAPAMEAAKACIAAGFKVYFGQQTYETTINDDTLINPADNGVVDEAVAALGQEHVTVGIMLNDSHGSWDQAAAVRRTKAIKAKYKNIGGVYWWESSRDGTQQSVTDVATEVFGL